MLSNLIHVEPSSPINQNPEDLLSSALSTLFPDDAQVQHGDSRSKIIYKSVCGELEFRCADVIGEEDKTKFAHYLWNSGILMGELVGGRPDDEQRKSDDPDRPLWLSEAEQAVWMAKGHRLLELGAGVGLSGIVAALSGADKVVLTDYPSAALLDILKYNANHNISSPLPHNVQVEPHLWGDVTSSFAEMGAHKYSRVIAADTIWLASQHDNLAQSMAHFLALDHAARVLIVAGFHTGRAIVAQFFESIPAVGLIIDEIWVMSSDGCRRIWDPERQETIGEGNRWMILASLKWCEDQLKEP